MATSLKVQRVCPDLEVLGVVTNGTHYKNKLTMREKDLLDRMARRCEDAPERACLHVRALYSRHSEIRQRCRRTALRCPRQWFASLVPGFTQRASNQGAPPCKWPTCKNSCVIRPSCSAQAGVKAVANDLERLAAGLAPFATLNVAQLADFLVQAESYARHRRAPHVR